MTPINLDFFGFFFVSEVFKNLVPSPLYNAICLGTCKSTLPHLALEYFGPVLPYRCSSITRFFLSTSRNCLFDGILTIIPNSTNGSLTARSATFGKIRGSRDGARSARRRIRGRTHAPSRTSAVWYYSFAHGLSTGQFELDRIRLIPV